MRGLVIRQREGLREARQAVRRHPPSPFVRPFGKIWKAIERDTRNYDDGEQNGME